MAKRRRVKRLYAPKRDVGDFSTNPHAFIARFGIVGNPITTWAIAHGALIDLPLDAHGKPAPEPPNRRDVLDPKTLRYLPVRRRLTQGRALR